MTAPTTNETMLERVRKLFAKAESVAGTPEADAFNAKAYDLLAKHGIAEAEARQKRGDGPAPVISKRFDIAGNYTMQQHTLLQILAEAVRCHGIRMRVRDNHTGKIDEYGEVYGTEADIAQLTLLFSTLMPQMLAGAKNVRRWSRPDTTVARRNFMAGFIDTVDTRLTEAERLATEDASPGTALVLIDDARRAEDALRIAHPKIRRSVARRQVDLAARDAGARAGARVDLGQSRVAGQRAIGR